MSSSSLLLRAPYLPHRHGPSHQCSASGIWTRLSLRVLRPPLPGVHSRLSLSTCRGPSTHSSVRLQSRQRLTRHPCLEPWLACKFGDVKPSGWSVDCGVCRFTTTLDPPPVLRIPSPAEPPQYLNRIPSCQLSLTFPSACACGLQSATSSRLQY
jgi:hypothetical protein